MNTRIAHQLELVNAIELVNVAAPLSVAAQRVLVVAAENQVSEPRILYCEVARCASCGRQHVSPTTGVMFDRCGCGGYLFAVSGAWSP